MALSIRKGERFFAPTVQRGAWKDRWCCDGVFLQQDKGGQWPPLSLGKLRVYSFLFQPGPGFLVRKGRADVGRGRAE
jgi:hypothetical protein